MPNNSPAQPVLTDEEIQDIADGFDIYGAKPEFARAIASALLSKLRAPVADERAARDWAEDFAHENGNYQCACVHCGEHFFGHKRRVCCKTCDSALASAPVAGEAIGYSTAIQWRPRQSEQSIKLTRTAQPEYGFVHALYAAPQASDLDAEYARGRADGFDAARSAPQASEAVRIVFPAHLRKMWSGGEVQAWLDEHQGVAAPKPSAKGSLERYRKWQAERDEAFAAGVKAAADLVKKMADGYDTDHGSTDPETGAREYPGEGASWVCEMQELEESIRALSAQPGAQRTGGSDAVPNEPLRIFSAGMWTYDGTGQAFTHTELDEAAFVTYRDALPAQKEKIDG